MKITRLRNKLLLSIVAISLLLALAYMSAVSWVIRQQHLDQSSDILLKASRVIEEGLAERKSNILAASRQLATQRNLGSTIWYLTQYAHSGLERETLFNTYQQLVRDTYKTGRVAKASRIAIYNSEGNLVTFALFDKSGDQAGFFERFPVPGYQVAELKTSDELNRMSLQKRSSVAGMHFDFGRRMPQQENVHYVAVGGLLSIESQIPIMGEAFDPATGKQETRQLGLLVVAQQLDQSFVEKFSRLTDTKINVFTQQGLGSGNLPAYTHPVWGERKSADEANKQSTSLNEISVDGASYYQGLIPLYSGNEIVGSIATLYSEAAVEKNIWQMIKTLWLIAAASLLFIFPFAWYFSTSISYPLTVLSRILLGVATDKDAGKLSDELKLLDKEVTRQDELGILTLSFISMNDAVNQKIRQINEINASLEQTINVRTAALVASEQESRTLIDNSPDTIARYDSECRRIYVNPAFGSMAEGGPAALLGKKPSENPGGPNAGIYEEKIREVFSSGKSSQFELEWPGKDGREFFTHIRLTPEFDLSGKLSTVLGVGRDITELKEAEQKLNNLLAFNKTILDRTPSGIAVFMESGQCIMANDAYARTIGATAEEALKLNFRSNASWQRNGLIEFSNQAFRTGQVVRHDIEGVTTFGKRVFLDCIFSPVTIAGEQHLLLITNDISERAEAVRALNASMHQLEEKELAKTRFLAAAGHDLRQPLAAASLFIDALKFTETTARQDQIIQRLDQAMITFNGLLDALLNISKLDAGIITPEYASINVIELMNWLEQNFTLLAAEKKLGFKLHFPLDEKFSVRSDIGLLKSVLMNLVSNAIKFTASGAILVSARRRGDDVLFQVWDTGMGIQAADIDKIFDEFYQINNPQRDRSKGLGLGLSIAKRALALLGRDISCRSRVGQGTVFEFTLPFCRDSYRVAQQTIMLSELGALGDAQFVRGKRFIVVEDDVLVAQAMINLLEGMGGEVMLFHNAEDALRNAHIEHADCYIVDYMLGGKLSGIEFLNLLRQQLGRDISAVLVTGDTSATIFRLSESCDWPVLHKPVNTSQLISELREQLAAAKV